ncbi:hypothetical protein DNTS_026012, partial [Danionella cerebrum]
DLLPDASWRVEPFDPEQAGLHGYRNSWVEGQAWFSTKARGPEKSLGGGFQGIQLFRFPNERLAAAQRRKNNVQCNHETRLQQAGIAEPPERSIEDAEEIERERRRRARESFRSQHSLSGCASSSQDGVNPLEAGLHDGELKASSPVVLDEDEGFSDWSQKLERRTRARTQENDKVENLQVEEKAVNDKPQEKTSFATSMQHLQLQEQEEDVNVPDRKNNERRVESIQRLDNSKRRQQSIMENKAKEERKEVKASYTSKVFHSVPNGCSAAAGEEVTSYVVKTKRNVDQDQVFEKKTNTHTGPETKLKLEKIRRSHQEKESQEMEHLRQRQAEAEQELEELKKKREERRRAREEEERRREEEEMQKVLKQEEEKRRLKEDIEKRRMEAAERRMKNFSVTPAEGDGDPFNPLNPASPTYKITERTESLNRSLKKSNSFKKTQTPVLLPKIEDKREQYTNAIEVSSKEVKMAKTPVMDMPGGSAPVASKKSLFEAGEVWSQSSLRGTPSKDTDCVKVGVANLINHWVKGNPEGGNRHSPSTPSDVKPGGVLRKKNMWEIIGESSAAEKSGLGGKSSSSGKQFKYVVTGHGKYEKIPSDGDHYSLFPNGKSSGFSSDDV